MRALPLGVRRQNVVAIVLGVISLSSLSLSEVLTFLPKRRQLGFRIFAWAPKGHKRNHLVSIHINLKFPERLLNF